MVTEFQQHEVAKLISDGTLMINDGYRAKNSELSHAGIPFARAGNIDGGFHFEDSDRVPAETLAKVGQKKSQAGDVVFTSKGTVGRFAFVREHTPEFVYSPQLCFWRSLDASLIDPRWLFYWMNGREFYLQFKGVSGQTDMAEYVSLRDQRAMKMTLPPLSEQKRIAEVLGALDDKIELNLRMNATLEATARALFQSWFIDFDPVRAKLDGRKPSGIDPATATLFPDSFEESPLGHIPKGWEVRPLASLTTYLSRGIGPSYLEQGGVCVLNQKCVRDHRVDFTKSRRHDSVKKPINKRGLQLHDVLVNSTGMGTLGRVAQLFYLPEATIVDSHVTIVRAASNTDPFFLGINLTGRETEIEELGEGSTGQTELSRIRLGGLKLITPSFDLQKAFGSAVAPLLMSMSENEKQSRTLSTLRDTLLPKLLSGELSAKALQI